MTFPLGIPRGNWKSRQRSSIFVRRTSAKNPIRCSRRVEHPANFEESLCTYRLWGGNKALVCKRTAIRPPPIYPPRIPTFLVLVVLKSCT